jgi:hypothetical protein
LFNNLNCGCRFDEVDSLRVCVISARGLMKKGEGPEVSRSALAV